MHSGMNRYVFLLPSFEVHYLHFFLIVKETARNSLARHGLPLTERALHAWRAFINDSGLDEPTALLYNPSTNLKARKYVIGKPGVVETCLPVSPSRT